MKEIPPNMKDKFLELENKWMTAWLEKDEAKARQLVADDFTLTSSLSNGELVNKEQWIEKALYNYHGTSFRFDDMKVRVYGNTAIVNGWYHQEAIANGKNWSGDFLITDIWVKKDADWQVVARHSSWLQPKM